MLEEEKISPGHTTVRNTLRIVGPIVLAVGALFMLTGLVNFFSAFGSMETPRLFWCCFVAIPLMFCGGVMCQLGFIGAMARYQAGEIAPVGKDTFNYMADGTKRGVETIATAIGAGLNRSSKEDRMSCPACGNANDEDAKFCDACGAALSKSCGSCGAVNKGNARFCDGCGSSFSAKTRS